MLDSNDGLKYVGLLSMVAIRQRLALMPTQKSKCEESLEFVNWLPWRMPKIEDWLPERSEFELPVPFLNFQTTALFRNLRRSDECSPAI
jgi:hypothetical protein